VSPPTRREVLARGAVAGGGLAAAALAGPPGAAASGSGDDDAILARAIAAEQRNALAYGTATRRLRSPAVIRSISSFGGQEREHARVLATALERLGGVAPQRPAQVPGLNAALAAGLPATLRLLLRHEESTIDLYHRAVQALTDSRLQQLSASIMANHGEHAAALRLDLGRSPVPNAFAGG
jgi:rubrerythrin